MYGIGMVRSAFRLRSAAASISSFPWLAVTPNKDDVDKLTFISHGMNDRIYKLPLPSSCGNNNNNISLKDSFTRSNKDGWMMFVCNEDRSFVPIIFNPLTGAQLEPLPSLYNFLNHRYPQWKHLDSDIFLTDNHIAFVECWVDDQDYHILVAATPGDDEWSSIPLPDSTFSNHINSIVFHDNKFYYMDCGDQMQSFRLTRRCCSGSSRGKKKIVFDNISSTLADATRHARDEAMLFDSHLVSDGTNLFRVRQCPTSKKFDMAKYCSYQDMWIEMTDMDLGNNSFFFDRYGARLLALGGGEGYQLQRREEKKGIRPRRNCIYFTDHGEIEIKNYRREIKNYLYFPYVGVYDLGTGTVQPCFPTTKIQSKYHLSTTLMWFIPSLSGQQLAS